MAESIPSLNLLIWLSVKPLIRILIPVAVGFLLVRTKVLPADGTRACALLQINFALPCLLFAKIVPSFTSDNTPALGPIILCGFFYQAFPAAIGFFARAFTPTPRRFRYGLIAAYAFGNWGDVPFSMVQSVTASSPFNGNSDETLGSAFVSIFILVNYISLFPLQGLRLCKLDYTRTISADLERRYEDGEFGVAQKWVSRMIRGCPMAHEVEEERRRFREEQEAAQEKAEGKSAAKDSEAGAKKRKPRMVTAGTQTFDEDEEITVAGPGLDPSSALRPPPHVDFPILEPTPSDLDGHLSPVPSAHSAASAPSVHHTTTQRVLLSIWSFFRPLVKSPPTMALLTALVISLVPALRALFVAPESGNSFHPTAPDGDPPLAILYQTADFVGGASVPIGLTVLGGSMAKLSIPRPVSRLPLQSIAAMAVIRLVVTAIVGFFLVNRLVSSGLVDSDATVLRFVLTLLSCVPTATTQVAYAHIFAGQFGTESNADLVAAYLILQYVVWAFANVVLTAVSLNNIFK
ncbi:hypothetical protein JCM10207_003330 [Rhodosporidiobolus poonsookiae]